MNKTFLEWYDCQFGEEPDPDHPVSVRFENPDTEDSLSRAFVVWDGGDTLHPVSLEFVYAPGQIEDESVFVLEDVIVTIP